MSTVLEDKDIGEKQFEEKTMKVCDSIISYYASKKYHKKTLILQHGAFMNNLTMMGLAKLFRGYNVFVPDLPNHGKSVTPYNVESTEDLTDIEYKFIKKLKETGEIEEDADITYAGWSLGGSIGQELALKDEKIVDRVVLISSSPIWETIPEIPADVFHNTFAKMYEDGIPENVAPERRKWMLDNFEAMMSSTPVCMSDIIVLHKLNIINRLKDIDLPILIISGDKDPVALPSCQQILSSKIKNSKLVMVSNEGHAMVIENSEKVYTEMIGFMSDLQKKVAVTI